MMNNIIIGGIPETGDRNFPETADKTMEAVHWIFLKNDLKMPEEQIQELGFERVRRFGARLHGKHRSICVVFKDTKCKDTVKSFRKHLDTKKTGHFMHDQYPPEVIVQRKKLIPIMLKARQDGKESYIKYNKLYVSGSVYTKGQYGNVE